MAEMGKLSFYVFLFIYKSWEKSPRCIFVFMSCPNQQPTWSCTTFQFKPIKTDSGHIEYMIKSQLNLLGKLPNKYQRCILRPSNYLVSYTIFSCSVFPSSITKTISGHFDKWTKYSSKIFCSCPNQFI